MHYPDVPDIGLSMTYLAVSILAKDEDGFGLQLARAKREGAQVIEIRADALMQPSVELVLRLVGLVKKAKLPVIVTCRDTKEGGFSAVEPSLRLSMH